MILDLLERVARVVWIAARAVRRRYRLTVARVRWETRELWSDEW